MLSSTIMMKSQAAAPRAVALNAAVLCIVGLVLLAPLRYIVRLDDAERPMAGDWALDNPADSRKPFALTRSQRRILDTYKEPPSSDSPMVVAKHPAPAVDIPEAALRRARAIYQERCASCHGAKGDGNGLGAAFIKPKPRDYTDTAWQKSVTNEELAEIIAKGGAAVGKSYMMPASRDLTKKSDVLKGLVYVVRAFAGSDGSEK